MAKQSLLSRLEDKNTTAENKRITTETENFGKPYVHPYFDDSHPSYSDPLPYTTPAFSTTKTVESKKIAAKKEKKQQSSMVFWILLFIVIVLLLVVIYGGLKMRGLVP